MGPPAAYAELVARVVAPAQAAAEASGKVGIERAGVGPQARRPQASAKNAERATAALQVTAARLEEASRTAAEATPL